MSPASSRLRQFWLRWSSVGAADSLTLFNRGATIVIAVRAASFRTGMALMYL